MDDTARGPSPCRHVFWPRRRSSPPDVVARDDERLAERRYRTYMRTPQAYGWMGAYQFEYMLRLGLRERDSLLDIGCGSLRGGRLFIPYLLPERYHGIDRELPLIEEGLTHELGMSILEVKRPTFLIDSDYTCSAFERTFDYVLAHSIFSHTPLTQMRRCLAEARKCMTPSSIFAASFTPGTSDYTGDQWGRATYRPETLVAVASGEGLSCRWDEVHPYGQQWVLFFLDGAEPQGVPPSGSLTQWVDPAVGGHVQIHEGGDGWPATVEFLAGETGRNVFRLSGPEVYERFQSDFHDRSGWQVQIYGGAGGLETELDADGVAGRYASGHAQDHLATEFMDIRPGVAGIVFFSVWAKPDHDARLPAVSLQDGDFSVIARALPRRHGPDGWVFLAGWARRGGIQRARMLIQQPFATSSRLRKASLVVADADTPG